MKPYSTVLFFHFVGLVGLFMGYGLEWIASSALRRATTGDQARTWLGLYRKSLPISGPALLLLILSGGYLASLTGGMKQGWLLASTIAIVIALVIGFVLILPRAKRIRAALPEGATALSGEVLARVQEPAILTLVRVRTTLALGIVYLMTVKPEFVESFVVLGIAMVLGVVLAAPAFGSKAK